MQTICFLLRGYVHRKNYIITFPGYGVTIEQTKGRNDDKSGDQVTLLQAFHRPWLITSLENTKQEMDCVPTFVIFQMESFLYSKTNILFSYIYIYTAIWRMNICFFYCANRCFQFHELLYIYILAGLRHEICWHHYVAFRFSILYIYMYSQRTADVSVLHKTATLTDSRRLSLI